MLSDDALELVGHRLLEGQAHLADLVAVAVLDQRLLDLGHRLLEDADEDAVVEDVALRLRRPATVVLAEQLHDSVRYGGQLLAGVVPVSGECACSIGRGF